MDQHANLFRIDLYTKLVLTVIAACLLAQSVGPFLHPSKVSAQGAARVIIDGINMQNLKYGIPVDLANTIGMNGQPITVPISVQAFNPQMKYGIPVDLANAIGANGQPITIPVILQAIQNNEQLKNGIPVEIANVGMNGKVPTLPVSISGTLPVNIMEVAGQDVAKEGVPVKSSTVKE
jgi:hypothetical protein